MGFLCDERKTSYYNIVNNPKMQMHAQYGHIITNYATILAITLVVWPKNHATSNMIAYFVKVFCDVCNFPSLIFFLVNITHNMTPREGFILYGLFLKFLYSFEIIFKMAGMKIRSPSLSLTKLAVDL
jgi:hypothetical protein